MHDSEVSAARTIAREARQSDPIHFDAHVAPVAAEARRLHGVREEALVHVHDVLGPLVTPDEMSARGVSSDTIRSGLVLVRHRDETYRRYIERVCASGDVAAIRVKMLGLQHALARPCAPGEAPLLHDLRSERRQLALLVLSGALAKLQSPV